jgi:Cu2+-exporting ATPase
MDVPISLAILLATGMSLYETSHVGQHAYFDAALIADLLPAGRALPRPPHPGRGALCRRRNWPRWKCRARAADRAGGGDDGAGGRTGPGRPGAGRAPGGRMPVDGAS